ncbi:hypothetical protein [Halomonas sp. RT37]|uniref:ATP-grasp fold RimK-type domain-containing protein n=1 Tax=Halomonas sp. RT37 TaxID=2950872 RepID=A0AAU7KMZ5_9GAMM
MIGIHARAGSFSDKWIEYFSAKGIPYKLVDCCDSNIMEQLEECNGLMWHWAHHDHRAVLFARQLTYALETSGKYVFPDSKTVWHFDDKVGQKYLFESIGAPVVPTHIFYNKTIAIKWAMTASYPKVFKLRGGAGAENVFIIKNYSDAKKHIDKIFGRGYKVKNRLNFLKERLWHFKRDRTLTSFLNISKGLARLVLPKEAEKKFPTEKNYAYFQDFIPGNDSDIRIIVIGDRAFGIKRMVRKGDFRASGSGNIIYDKNEIPIECIRIAFEVNARLGAQCLAYDFVYKDKKPLIVEVSYSYSREAYIPCPGYWTRELEWVPTSFFPEYFMAEDFSKLI